MSTLELEKELLRINAIGVKIALVGWLGLFLFNMGIHHFEVAAMNYIMVLLSAIVSEICHG